MVDRTEDFAVKERIVAVVWNALIGQSRMFGLWRLVGTTVGTITVEIKMLQLSVHFLLEKHRDVVQKRQVFYSFRRSRAG